MSDHLTDADLARIEAANRERRARREAATPGDHAPNWGYLHECDRNLLAAARTDDAAEVIDALVAEVRRLRPVPGTFGQCCVCHKPIERYEELRFQGGQQTHPVHKGCRIVLAGGE